MKLQSYSCTWCWDLKDEHGKVSLPKSFCLAPVLAVVQNCCNWFDHPSLFPGCLFSAYCELVQMLRSCYTIDSITLELHRRSQTHRCWLTGQQQPGMIALVPLPDIYLTNSTGQGQEQSDSTCLPLFWWWLFCLLPQTFCGGAESWPRAHLAHCWAWARSYWTWAQLCVGHIQDQWPVCMHCTCNACTTVVMLYTWNACIVVWGQLARGI